jgi:hypothetical protein
MDLQRNPQRRGFAQAGIARGKGLREKFKYFCLKFIGQARQECYVGFGLIEDGLDAKI